MQGVAAGLLRYFQQHGTGEEEGVGRWATSAAPFEHALKLEPYVGSVKVLVAVVAAWLLS